MRQSQAPFLASAAEYVRLGVYPLHTPAHKQGRFGDAEFLAALGSGCLLDVDPPEIPVPGGGGRAQAPAEALAEAERLAAELYGADRTLFLVNGATQGIQAMLLALTRPGEPVLVPRHAHRSVAAGLILAGSEPVFMSTAIDPAWGVPHAMKPQDVSAASRAVRTGEPAQVHALVTSPNYWGLAEELTGIGRCLAERGGLLLCDEAHGAHLPFLPDKPVAPSPALSSGAAVSVQSPHKMLGSLVQSSWLHVKGDAALQQRVAAAVGLLSTSSPSFLLLSSLDAVRRWAAGSGPGAFGAAAELSAAIRAEVSEYTGFVCLDEVEARRLGYVGLDPLKLTIRPRDAKLSGLDVARHLQRHGLQVELASPLHVTLVLSPSDDESVRRRIVTALSGLSGRTVPEAGVREVARLLAGWPATIPARLLGLREAFLGSRRTVPLAEAGGQVAADLVAPYPPGIPVLYPGEAIDGATVDFLTELVAAGLHVDGLRASAGGALLDVVRDPV